MPPPPPSSPPSLPSPTSSTTSSTSTTSAPPRRKARVTPEHTLTRVRENQRRHRARRKDYIATLEEKLAQAEQQLAEARAEIEALRRERDSGVLVLPCPHGDGEGEGAVVRKDSVVGEGMETGVDIGMNGVENVGEEDAMVLAQAPSRTLAAPGLEYPNPSDNVQLDIDASFLNALYNLDALPTPIPTSMPALGPPPCCTDLSTTTATPPPDPSDPECSTCKTRPAPLPTESTTLCAQAYVMISQQNFRDVDATTIRLWLYQGYRRAQRRGEGCRVENGALFRLLDFISGV
ncbi:hypothetical protein K458DRAFT_397551 [Lentithecium fluviatile CBS 122367]|uniref:BZIP domain-containing protein n=1 Tax=Lentithecium fluviatile CBS 122367 TaxID=1168545 RepID=A0A6G1ID27_9PLEO|nr:hypothetical protein K458DRAFT_397551 [Lentithecium fluviatile CBS 122367]